MSRDPGGAEALAFFHALAAAPEGEGLGRGREGSSLRGESIQAKFRGARRFAQQRVRFVQAPV